MPSRTDINKISVTTPSINKMREAKKLWGYKSYEQMINSLIDARILKDSETGDNNAE